MLFKNLKNIGIIGRGRWGKKVISNLKDISNIKFIYGKNINYKNIDDNIDWIFILSPNTTHFKLVKKFLKKNFNVFCEKPLSENIKDSLTLYNLADNKKKKLYVDDVEIFKNKKINIKNSNFIIRRKKDSGRLFTLIDRLFYHDAYLLANKINLKKISRVKIFVNECLNIEFFSNKKKFSFIYDINSKKKIHTINNTNFLKFKGNPLKKMFTNFLYKKGNFIQNKKRSLFAQKLTEKIKTTITKKYRKKF